MMVEYKGKMYATVRDAAEATGEKYSTVYARVKAEARKAKHGNREVNRMKLNWQSAKEVLEGKFPK